jgi:hypothetical protein
VATEPTKLRLKAPIALGSETIEELTFRRGRFGDLKGIDLAAVNMDAIMVVAGRLSGQTTAVIERLDEEDVGEVVAIVTGFFARSLGTSPKL